MGCRKWLGFEGGVGVVGRGGSEGIVPEDACQPTNIVNYFYPAGRPRI